MPLLTVTLWCILDFYSYVIKIFDLSLSFIRLFLTVKYFLYISCIPFLVLSTVNYMLNFLTVSAMPTMKTLYVNLYQLNQHFFMVSLAYIDCLIMHIVFSLCFFSQISYCHLSAISDSDASEKSPTYLDPHCQSSALSDSDVL